MALVLKKSGKTQGIIGLSLGAASFLVALITTVIFFAPTPSTSDIADPIADESVTVTEPLTDESEDISIPDTNVEVEPPVNVGIPAGFEDGGAGVAWRFVDEYCVVWEYCVVVELYAYDNCPGGVDLTGNEIDYDTDTIYDTTFESAGVMYSGDYAVLELGVFNPRANGVELTDLVCYQ